MADYSLRGYHEYVDQLYVPPEAPVTLERIEWFMDQKIGLQIHFGIYNQMGI